MNPLLRKGLRQTLDRHDYMPIEDDDDSRRLSTALTDAWHAEVQRAHRTNTPPQLWRAVFKVFGLPYLWPGLSCLAETCVKIGQAVLLGYLLRWFQNPLANPNEGYYYALGMSLTVVAHALLHHFEFFAAMRVGMQLRTAFIATIYRKCLALSISHTSSTGLIVNLVSNDVQRFEDAAPFSHFFWLGPLEVLLITYFMWLEISWAAFAAVLALLALIPIQGSFARQFGRLRKSTVGYRDERIKSISDCLAGIMVVKLYAWEAPFRESIDDLRNKELGVVRKASRLRAMNEAFYFASPVVIEIFAFLTYWLMGGELTAAKVFTCIVYLASIQLSMTNFYPVSPFPYHSSKKPNPNPINFCNLQKALQFVSESRVSLSRIQAFLSLPEMAVKANFGPDAPIFKEVDDASVEIAIRNGSFAWGPEGVARPTLTGVDLTVKKGELIVVVGPVGAGKSSLLQALLGEMESLPDTRVGIRTQRIAYCTQTPFIFSGTIEENILFGQPLSEPRLRDVIRASAMESDMALFPKGRHTVIGERGITLSGGQRARLALARALYSDADVYLLDDPLAAVDAAVGKYLFEVCINGFLAGKTRVLVTHQLQFAKRCGAAAEAAGVEGRVVVLENGRVMATGSFEEVVMAYESPFAVSMRDIKENLDVVADSEVELSPVTPWEAKAREAGFRVEDEEDAPPSEPSSGTAEVEEELRDEKRVLRATVGMEKGDGKEKDEEVAPAAIEDSATPVKTGGDGTGISKELAAQGHIPLRTYTTFFLAGAPATLLSVLIVLLVLGEVVMVMCNWYLARWSAQSKDNQRWPGHVGIFTGLALGTLLISVVRAIMFFDITLNATELIFKKMLGSVLRAPMSFFRDNPHGRMLNDEMLPLTAFDFIQCLLMIVGTFGIAIAVIPWVCLSIPLITFVFLYLRRIYINTSRQIKRDEAITRSPIYSMISTTLEGLSTIRAFGKEDGFLDNFIGSQNENSRIYFCFLSSARWLGFRLDILSASFLVMVAFLAVGLQNRGTGLSSGTVGLLLSYALQLMGLLQWAVRQSTEVENLMVSVERMLEYTSLPSEAPAETDVKLPKQWPSAGDIKIDGMAMTYTGQTRPALRDVNIQIPGGTKVGVVGRTGAGKSSLIQALFRLEEPTPANSIVIDGVPTTSLGLADLRGRISIIPQEPFCFKGTLRFNLDPFGKHTDADLWRALASVELKETVEQLPDKLDSLVAENGSNWSVGERQLVCLARAILRDSKLIVMDEATSAVDMRTDALVQRAIRAEGGLFAEATVLTIAHRLQTIIDFDRVMVLSAGAVVEYGSPLDLLNKDLSDPGAWFCHMVSELGPDVLAAFREQLSKKALEVEKPTIPAPSDPSLK
ncbi:Multidrug resistance-associated protein 4 [Phlyctochytrium bullatum]|nr:Multidrug resistance-associated protein 4 [Phlyctochytrium bullatum]